MDRYTVQDKRPVGMFFPWGLVVTNIYYIYGKMMVLTQNSKAEIQKNNSLFLGLGFWADPMRNKAEKTWTITASLYNLRVQAGLAYNGHDATPPARHRAPFFFRRSTGRR